MVFDRLNGDVSSPRRSERPAQMLVKSGDRRWTNGRRRIPLETTWVMNMTCSKPVSALPVRIRKSRRRCGLEHLPCNGIRESRACPFLYRSKARYGMWIIRRCATDSATLFACRNHLIPTDAPCPCIRPAPASAKP